MRRIFLDRDGVINRFPGVGHYVTSLKELHVLPSALRGIRLLTKAGYQMHVTSNQGCVARGMITKTDLWRLTRRMCRDIKKAGGRLHQFHYCLHRSSQNCACKKPKTFLLKKAFKGSKAQRGDIWFIGDSDVDVRAGRDYGCRTMLVLSGRTKRKGLKDLPVKPDKVQKNLYEAAKWILKEKRS